MAEINRAAARLAKKATAAYMAAHPGSRKFVAGAIGPTNKTLSVSPSVENPALRGITYDEVEEAYYAQAKALWEGGCDLFLVETIFDTGNAKAAIYALERFFQEQVGGWEGGRGGGGQERLGRDVVWLGLEGGWLGAGWCCAPQARQAPVAAFLFGFGPAPLRQHARRAMHGLARAVPPALHPTAAVPALRPAPPHPPAGRAHPRVHQRHDRGQLGAHAERADQRGVLEQRQPRWVLHGGGGGSAAQVAAGRWWAGRRRHAAAAALLCERVLLLCFAGRCQADRAAHCHPLHPTPVPPAPPPGPPRSQAAGHRSELRAGRQRHEAVHRQPVCLRRLLRVLLPQRRPAQRHGRLRPEGAGDGGGDPPLL